MSFQGLEDDIRYNCSIVPFSFSSARTAWNVIWQEGLLFEKENSDALPVRVNEDEFFEIWSDIRNSGIALKSEAGSAKRLVLDLLLSLGYVSEIRITDKRNGEKSDGYQINSGEGRVYALKGRADEL